MKLLNYQTSILPDEDPDISYLEQDGFEDRLEQFKCGKFDFIGINAIAQVLINNTVQAIGTPGLWGIESDSDETHLDSVRAEELSTLGDILAEMGIEHSLDVEESKHD